MKEHHKKLMAVFLLLATLVLAVAIIAHGVNLRYATADEIIMQQSDYLYETGIKIVEDGQIVENQVFIDIPIGIAVWGSETTIKNCTFINCSDEGIVFFEMSHNNTIKNCIFYGCIDGVELQSSHNNSFYNCVFIENSHAAIDAIHGANNNNTFFNCGFYNNYMVMYCYDSYGNAFVDCVFSRNKVDTINRRY